MRAGRQEWVGGWVDEPPYRSRGRGWDGDMGVPGKEIKFER